MAFFASYIAYVYSILYPFSFASRDFVDTSGLNFIKYDSLMDFLVDSSTIVESMVVNVLERIHRKLVNHYNAYADEG